MSNPKEINVVTTKILDREFKIKCPQDKVAELQKTAVYLDNKMREIYHGDKFATVDRVAVAAALNIAHELIFEKNGSQTSDHEPNNDLNDLNKRLLNIKDKVQQTLAKTT